VEVGGAVETGFGAVRDAFAETVAGQEGTGASVAIWYDGAWVANLWGGYADAARTRPWRQDSIVQPYSVTKPFAALCLLILVDRGHVDLDEPMQRYWPELRAAATVRQVLSHQAGLVLLDRPAATSVFFDWAAMCARIAEQSPSWEPGTAIGESALLYGHLVGEVVRRVDGRSLGRFLRDEVCGPLALDFAVGLDASEQSRVVDLTGLEAFRRTPSPDRPPLYEVALGNPPGVLDSHIVNGPAWRAAEVPAVNGHGTARAVAGCYAALLQRHLLSADLLAEATSAQCTGEDLVIGGETSWGLGFGVDADGYGMGGIGGSYGWASTADGYSFGFVTGSMGESDRGERIESAFRACAGLPPM
jgi:CubicO group peptidase (beta-lactamase class C family)